MPMASIILVFFGELFICNQVTKTLKAWIALLCV